jgi:hypothetical protein
MTNDNRPQFSWIVIYDYYDGPMSGLAVAETSGQMAYFRAVAWDAEECQRVYAMTQVDSSLGRALVDGLTALEEPRRPVWAPGPASVTGETTAAWARLREAAQQSRDWTLVQSHDLVAIEGSIELSASESRHVAALAAGGTIATLASEDLLGEFLARLKASKA